jgi:hypothetical protein
MFNFVAWSAFNEKIRFRILNPMFWFNCLQLVNCKLQGWCKILLLFLAMLLSVFLILCITKVYLTKRSSILNVLKSKVHVTYWRAYMHIFHTIHKKLRSSLDWSTLWKIKVNGFWKTSKPIGFRCYSQLRKFYLNIGP